jgi:hypothetical protein
VKRPAVACLVLLAVYVGLAFLNDDRGYLGTDTGAKVATLGMMAEHDRFDPDVGYWAEKWDPDGRLHPLFVTVKFDERWVQVTTLPALYAAMPLYELGGYRLTLLLPMLGSVLAALGGRALSQRLGADDTTGWVVFWLIGLASPLTVYALDFWEHSLGVACVIWATCLLTDAAESRRWVRAGGAGLLFGLAATMRTEALVYGAVLTAAACLVILLARRDVLGAAVTGVLVSAGLGLAMLANVQLEQATLGGTLRSSRAVTAANIAGGPTTTGAGRIEEAALTTLGLQPRLTADTYLLGAALLALLVAAAWRARRDDPGPARVAIAGAAALYLIRAADGFGFVPGLVAAAPIAVVGVVWGWADRWSRRVPLAVVAALPLVWRFQFTGGAPPQWAGRYVLPTTIVLVAIGATRLQDLDRFVRRGFVALAVGVTAFGVAWLSVRSHDVARTGEALAKRPEPVLVSRIAHLFREEGHWYPTEGHRWLTVPTGGEEGLLPPVLAGLGVERFGWIDLEGSELPAISGYAPDGSASVPFLSGVRLRITTFVKD